MQAVALEEGAGQSAGYGPSDLDLSGCGDGARDEDDVLGWLARGIGGVEWFVGEAVEENLRCCGPRRG